MIPVFMFLVIKAPRGSESGRLRLHFGLIRYRPMVLSQQCGHTSNAFRLPMQTVSFRIAIERQGDLYVQTLLTLTMIDSSCRQQTIAIIFTLGKRLARIDRATVAWQMASEGFLLSDTSTVEQRRFFPRQAHLQASKAPGTFLPEKNRYHGRAGHVKATLDCKAKLFRSS